MLLLCVDGALALPGAALSPTTGGPGWVRRPLPNPRIARREAPGLTMATLP